MLLFLDYDGVLHPDAVYRRINGAIELRAPGELFMWAPLLADAISEVSGLHIVLSTSWVRELGFRKARAALPQALADRVIGATWHSAMGKVSLASIVWDSQTRYQQIQAYLHRSSSSQRWVAIDDDVQGWPQSHRQSLIQTDPCLGVSDPHTLRHLRTLLKRYATNPTDNSTRSAGTST
jgi:hypothetical protein